MSLQVWLPLNGTLDNIGCSGVTVTNNGATVDNSGKIGKCYYFSGSTWITMTMPEEMTTIKNTSVCAWIKSTGTVVALGGISHDGGADKAHMTLYTSGWQFGGGSGYKYVSGGTIANTSVWHHVCCTLDDTTITTYLDGTKVTSKTLTEAGVTVTDITSANFLEIGCDHPGGNEFLTGYVNDFRVYSHCLSAAEVKEISQGLVLHYKLDDLLSGNMIKNGYGDLGLENWTNASRVSTDVPTADTSIKQSFYNQWTKEKVPIIQSHQYQFSCYVKSTGTSGYTYPSFQPYDIDGKALNYFHEPEGFQAATRTTLAQPLKTGDTKIYATSLTNWPDHTNSRMVAIFSYRDSHGNLYPDWEYTQNTVVYGTSSNLNKSTNVITLSNAYTGPTMPTGTSICQTVYGSTYWYPFGGITKTSISAWVAKTMTFIPKNINRLKYAHYITYLADWQNDILHAGMKLIDLTYSNNVSDSSGYNHNGTITGNLSLSNNTPRYQSSTYFEDYTRYISCLLDNNWIPNAVTMSCWIKGTNRSARGGFHIPLNMHSTNFEISITSSSGLARMGYVIGGTRYVSDIGSNILDGNWHMLTSTFNGSTICRYIDGTLINSENRSGALTAVQTLGIGAFPGGTTYGNTQLYESDVRIYATALPANDILQLYHTSAKIDNKGCTHAYEFIEHQDNILFPAELSRTKLEFTNGLSRYTQSNCQVTLVEEGYHIYRPPNLTTSANGNTMFGGLKLVNQSTDTVSPYNATRDNIWNLQKGHSYILAFHAEGQSSNPHNYLSFNNNMGWGVGGVSPTPTLIAANGIPADFQGEKDCYYAFTINDDIVKTSNDARAGYDGSSQYLSYRHFTFGWTYSNTGTLGTDIYLTNFRLYDITTHVAQFTKQGIANFSQFIEQMDKAQIRKNSELLSSEFLEL